MSPALSSALAQIFLRLRLACVLRLLHLDGLSDSGFFVDSKHGAKQAES